MASHLDTFGSAPALPLSVALSVIPSLPRPLLARLVARAIERLDEIDGDCDVEEDDPPEDEHDRELIDEREPELYEGGYSDGANFEQTRMGDLTPSSWQPDAAMRAVKQRLRELRRAKGGPPTRS